MVANKKPLAGLSVSNMIGYDVLLHHNVGDDRGRLEDDLIVVDVGWIRLYLFGEVRHVVTQPQEVFLVGVWPCLARDSQFTAGIVVAQRAQSLNGEDVVIGYPVVEHDAPGDLEIIGRCR